VSLCSYRQFSVFSFVYVCMCVYMYMYVFMYICICVYVCVRARAHPRELSLLHYGFLRAVVTGQIIRRPGRDDW